MSTAYLHIFPGNRIAAGGFFGGKNRDRVQEITFLRARAGK